MIAHAVALAGAAVSLLGLGVVMGTSPTLYAVVVKVLSSASAPGVSLRWLLAGVVTGTTVLLLVFRLVDPETITAILERRAEDVLIHRLVDLMAGAVFLGLAVRAALRMRRPRESTKPPAPPGRDRPGAMFLAGVVNTVVGVSGAATMYVTGRVIASASRDLVIDLALYVVFLVAVVGPYLLLGSLWSRFPTVGPRIMARLSRVDRRPFVLALLLLAALAFLMLGVLGQDRVRELLS